MLRAPHPIQLLVSFFSYRKLLQRHTWIFTWKAWGLKISKMRNAISAWLHSSMTLLQGTSPYLHKPCASYSVYGWDSSSINLQMPPDCNRRLLWINTSFLKCSNLSTSHLWHNCQNLSGQDHLMNLGMRTYWKLCWPLPFEQKMWALSWHINLQD